MTYEVNIIERTTDGHNDYDVMDIPVEYIEPGKRYKDMRIIEVQQRNDTNHTATVIFQFDWT